MKRKIITLSLMAIVAIASIGSRPQYQLRPHAELRSASVIRPQYQLRPHAEFRSASVIRPQYQIRPHAEFRSLLA